MSSDKWEKVGPSGGIMDLIIPLTRHEIVRNTETGKAKEICIGLGETTGEAIEKGQFTDRDVSACDRGWW
jgi:hypothetical protein